MDAIIDGFDTITNLVTAGWEMLTSNPYLVVFMAVSLLGVGLTVLSRLKAAAQS